MISVSNDFKTIVGASIFCSFLVWHVMFLSVQKERVEYYGFDKITLII